MAAFSRVVPSVYVADLDRSARFYVDVLGFAVECVDDPPARTVVKAGSAVIHLDLVPSRAGSSRLHMLSDDLAGTCDRLVAAGACLLQQPTDQPWGLRELVAADPDGNALEIAQPIGRPAAGSQQ